MDWQQDFDMDSNKIVNRLKTATDRKRFEFQLHSIDNNKPCEIYLGIIKRENDTSVYIDFTGRDISYRIPLGMEQRGSGLGLTAIIELNKNDKNIRYDYEISNYFKKSANLPKNAKQEEILYIKRYTKNKEKRYWIDLSKPLKMTRENIND